MFKRELIKKMVEAIGVKAGDIVLIQLWGEDENIGLLHDFSYEVAAAGGTPMEQQHSRIYYKNLFEATEEKCYSESFFNIFKDVKVVIDICTYEPVRPHKEFSKDKIGFYREYMKELFKSLSSKEKFVQIRVPTIENSLESDLDFEEYKTLMMKAYDINYNELKIKSNDIVNALLNRDLVKIITGKDHELYLSLKSRKWYIDAGDGDLPCGEIYIAPIENSAKGSIIIEKFFLEGEILKNLDLTFKDGRLINSSSEIFNEYLKTLPENANILCELGIGLNENVTDLVGYTALDEKTKGTIHIAIGMNTMFGGSNQCSYHKDFVFKGTLIFNDEIKIKDGEVIVLR